MQKKKRKHSIICIKVLLEGFIDTYTVNAQGKKQWGQDRALMCSFMLEYTQTLTATCCFYFLLLGIRAQVTSTFMSTFSSSSTLLLKLFTSSVTFSTRATRPPAGDAEGPMSANSL